ncbi:hypothetical protein V1477_000446 [Vespula maculifrons]|uniref:Uncharacterized protein n=1 Tax=Vespula maculifrons TaxID=7453 RepID=A0ABD2D1L6_VESMC
MKIVSQPNDENLLSSIPANTLGRHGYDVRERVSLRKRERKREKDRDKWYKLSRVYTTSIAISNYIRDYECILFKRFPSKLLTSTCRARTLSSVTTSRCRLCPSDRGKVLGNICDTPYIHATLYLLYTHRHYKCSNEGTTTTIIGPHLAIAVIIR